jgi:hypothetical protein
MKCDGVPDTLSHSDKSISYADALTPERLNRLELSDEELEIEELVIEELATDELIELDNDEEKADLDDSFEEPPPPQTVRFSNKPA